MHGRLRRHEPNMQILDRYDRRHTGRPVRRGERHRQAARPAWSARLWPEPGRFMWQATARPSSSGIADSVGGTAAHTASAKGQRVRKRQPEGGLIGFGGSPMSGATLVRSRGFIDGIAESSAFVYG